LKGLEWTIASGKVYTLDADVFVPTERHISLQSGSNCKCNWNYAIYVSGTFLLMELKAIQTLYYFNAKSQLGQGYWGEYNAICC